MKLLWEGRVIIAGGFSMYIEWSVINLLPLAVMPISNFGSMTCISTGASKVQIWMESAKFPVALLKI